MSVDWCLLSAVVGCLVVSLLCMDRRRPVPGPGLYRIPVLLLLFSLAKTMACDWMMVIVLWPSSSASTRFQSMAGDIADGAPPQCRRSELAGHLLVGDHRTLERGGPGCCWFSCAALSSWGGDRRTSRGWAHSPARRHFPSEAGELPTAGTCSARLVLLARHSCYLVDDGVDFGGQSACALLTADRVAELGQAEPGPSVLVLRRIPSGGC